MGFLKRKPNKLERLLAAARLDEALAQVEPAIPAGSLIATRTGNVAHVKSGLPGEGALCQEMRLWTGWRVVRSGEVLKMCHRCELARDGRPAS